MSESRAPKYLIATGAALLYVALVGGGPGGPGTGPRPTTTTLDAGRAGGGGPAAALAPFTYTNAYGTVAVGDSSYPTFADSAIVEPYRSTALGLGAGVDAATATVTVTRTRRGSRATPVPFFDGSAWTLGFEDVGNYRVTVCVESQPIQDTFNLSVPERIFEKSLFSRRELGERIRTVQESLETSSI